MEELRIVIFDGDVSATLIYREGRVMWTEPALSYMKGWTLSKVVKDTYKNRRSLEAWQTKGGNKLSEKSLMQLVVKEQTETEGETSKT